MTTYREIGICNGTNRLHIAVTYADGNQQTLCYDSYHSSFDVIEQLDFQYICNNLFGIERKCRYCNFICEDLYFPDNVIVMFEDGKYFIYKIYDEYEIEPASAFLFESESLDETLDYLRDRYSYLIMPIKVAIKNE